METKKKKIQWSQWLVMAVFVLIGAACGFLMVEFVWVNSTPGTPFWQDLLKLGLLVLLIYAAIFLQLVIHEAGHLLFGLWSGYQFSSFRIGSLMWLREEDKTVLKKLKITGTGGQCLMVPPDMVEGRFPVVLYNLGGSFMNLLVGAVFAGIYAIAPVGGILSTVSVVMAVVGLILALMNGIPLRTGTVDNDGYNALSLRKSRDAMRAFWIQMKINEQISKGVRLKEMPEGWFIVPTDGAMQNSLIAALGVFACNRLMDQREFAEADSLMARLLTMDSGMAGIHRSLLICDRLYCELIGQNRPEVLTHMLKPEQKKFMKTMQNFPSIIRTQYVFALLAEKDPEKAENIRKRFEKVGKTYPYPSDIQSERELMELAAASVQVQ